MVWQNERLEFCLLALADQVLSRGSIPDPKNAVVPRKYSNFCVYQIRES